MTFPISYDDDNLLFGDLTDQKTLVLNAPCTDLDTRLYFESVIGVSAPTFIRIADELIYVTGVNSGSLDVERDPNMATDHPLGSAAYLVVTANHFNILRDRAVETQKYQGLVGLDANKPITPEISEVYVATDARKVWVCLTAGQWSLLGGAVTHADTLLDGETDDHNQYYTAQRLADWHSALTGEHVTDGDNHDHRHGSGAGRVQTATSSTLPSMSTGHVRLATDTSELFIATAPGSWVAITGAPRGAIVMLKESDAAYYGNACPPGWSRYVELDAKFPKGAPAGITSPLNAGGAATHYHTYAQVPAHSHTVPAMHVDTANEGNHSHTFPFSTASGGTGFASQGSGTANDPYTTQSSGSHTHTFSYPAVTTSTVGGGASANSSTASNLPPYQEVIFCKKD